jgi:putative ABC transport system permease protein
MSHLLAAASWRIALRDLRGGISGFVVFLASLALGVAAIVAVGSLNRGVQEAVTRDARALLGGDVVIDAANLAVPEEEVRSLLPQARELSLVTRSSTVVQTATGQRLPVSLKAVDAAWPLYGAALLEPDIPMQRALADHGAIVERVLLSRLKVRIGDRLRLGKVDVTIRGVLVVEPDRLGGFVSFGPRMLVSQSTLAASGILAPGALAEFSWRSALPQGADPTALVAEIRQANPDARWRARAVDDVQPQVARFTDRLATYLTLAGLTALLTGGLGIGLAIEGYLGARRTGIAAMKCLGAPGGQIFAIYLLQVLILAAIGVVAGLVLGQLVPLAVFLVPAGIVPVLPAYGLYFGPIAMGAAAGLLTALAFAILPLALARQVSPAELFRTLVAGEHRRPPWVYYGLVGLLVLALTGLAIAAAPQPWLAFWFVVVAGGSAIILAAMAWALLRAIARVAQHAPPGWRLPLANLHRPGSGAASVVIAVGAGLAVLTTVGLLQANLTAEVESRVADRAPRYVFIDIQPDQVAPFRNIVQSTPGATLLQQAPTLRARVIRIQGQPVDQVQVAGNVAWTLRRDRGLSYQREMPQGTELVAGSWWPADYQGPPLVSVEDEVAYGYGVGVGDTLAFNILGRTIEARIANLRKEIDWSSGRLDFVFILSPGVIEAAPHSWIAAVDLPESEGGRLVDEVAGELPNVTPIEVGEVARQVEDVLGKIALAIRSVAAVTLVSGALVLAGAVGAARRRHRYQAVMLKVLGARRRDVVRLFVIEYLALGLTAALVGVLIGTAAAAGVVTWFFGNSFIAAPATIATVVVLALALALAAGIASLWRALGQSAAAVLRSA